jgi:selenocysteine lyase/cysteine desulfurase
MATSVGSPAARLPRRRLGELGLQVWSGDFYAVRAVEILGLAEKGGVVRTGVVMYNTRDEIDRLLAGLSRSR